MSLIIMYASAPAINDDPFIEGPSNTVSAVLSLTTPMLSSQALLDVPPSIDADVRATEDTGMYEAEDGTLRAFICSSPKAVTAPRTRTEVDLVLPPAAAFYKKGMPY